FDGTTGTGYGARASRPATCTTGVAYWSTDQGSWNSSGAGGNGVLDKCTSTNTWTNAWYVPYDYPNALANITDSGATLTFTVQPSTTVSGHTMSSVTVTDSDSSFSGTITLTISGCGASASNNTATASAGIGTFATMGMTASGSSCTFTASATGASD